VVGDVIFAPATNGNVEAQVSTINVPEAEIEDIRRIMKVIPSSTIKGIAKEIQPPSHEDAAFVLPEGWMDAEQGPIPTPTEVMIRVSPEQDEAVVALQTEAAKLLQYAESRVILADGDVKLATDDLGFIATLIKTLEGKRKEYTGPLRGYAEAINNTFKGITDPLVEADKSLRGKIVAYDREQARQRAEEEEINRLRREAAQKEMKLKGELTESVGEVEVRPQQPDHYRGEATTAGKRVNWKWKVVDFARVPDRYKLVDATTIGKVVRAGERVIPGIEIYPEQGITITTKQ
jgi:hypothetical protein